MDLDRTVRQAQEIQRKQGIPAVCDEATSSMILSDYDTFLFDCDGVLWYAGELIQGTREVLTGLAAMGKRVVFVTNNSTKSRVQYAKKFAELGLAVPPEMIYPSSYCAAQYLRQRLPHVNKVFVIGGAGLIEEIEAVGVQVVSYTRPDGGLMSIESEADFMAVPSDPNIGAVVCGWDMKFDFTRMAYASLCLQRDPSCVFVACNLDSSDKLPGRCIPGNGGAVAAIETASGRTAIVAGKPASFVGQLLSQQFPDMTPARTVMIGDRLDTDIALGAACGYATLLTLTGTTDLATALTLHRSHALRPTYTLPFVGALVMPDPEHPVRVGRAAGARASDADRATAEGAGHGRAAVAPRARM